MLYLLSITCLYWNSFISGTSDNSLNSMGSNSSVTLGRVGGEVGAGVGAGDRDIEDDTDIGDATE